jgi:hypothetical protein
MDKRLASRNRGFFDHQTNYRPERSVPARGSQRPGETDAAKRLQLPEFLTGSTAAGFGSYNYFALFKNGFQFHSKSESVYVCGGISEVKPRFASSLSNFSRTHLSSLTYSI